MISMRLKGLALALSLLAAACGGKGGSGDGTGGSSGGTSSGGTSGGVLTSGNPIGLWMSGVFSLTATQLQESFTGSPSPSDECNYVTGTNSGPAVFDGQGDLWTQYGTGNTLALYMWSPANLEAACSGGVPARAITLSPTDESGWSQIVAMAFDSNGTLWLSMTDGQILLGVSSSQLAASGTVEPEFVVEYEGFGAAASQLAAPTGLAFDSSDNLWVGNGYSVLEYSASSLAGANGAPSTFQVAPIAFLSTAASEAGAAAGCVGVCANYPTFNFVAFDSSGDLWVDGDNNAGSPSPGEYLAEYTATQLAALGTSQTPTPVLTIPETAEQIIAKDFFGALAFDGSGNLWLGSVANLYGYLSVNLAKDLGLSTPLPPDYSLTNLWNGTGGSLAFNPIPSGLPLQP